MLIIPKKQQFTNKTKNHSILSRLSAHEGEEDFNINDDEANMSESETNMHKCILFLMNPYSVKSKILYLYEV